MLSIDETPWTKYYCNMHLAIHHQRGSFSYRNKKSFLIFFFVTVRQMGIKGAYISTATPLIGQERSRKMPTPVPHLQSLRLQGNTLSGTRKEHSHEYGRSGHKTQFWHRQVEADDLQFFKACFPNDKVYSCVCSHVCLFQKKFWPSKVMYRGSAAGVTVERGFCSNLPQKPRKGDDIH